MYSEAARLEFVAMCRQGSCVNCVLLDDVVVQFCVCVRERERERVLKFAWCPHACQDMSGHARMKYSDYAKAKLFWALLPLVTPAVSQPREFRAVIIARE